MGIRLESQPPLTELAHLINPCRLMESLHHRDLHPEEPHLIQHHRRTELPHPTGVLHQQDQLPPTPMERLLPIHMESAPLILILMNRQHRIALLHPMGPAHLTALHMEHPLIQPRLLMSLP